MSIGLIHVQSDFLVSEGKKLSLIQIFFKFGLDSVQISSGLIWI